MDRSKDIVKFEDDTGNVLAKTLLALAEGITGIAASDKKDLILSVGHIFQSLRKGQFLSRLSFEWNNFREKGKIKDDYQKSEQHYTCLQELLDFLDNDSPDEVRFDVLKKIFLVAASEDVTDRDSLLPNQYMKVCRSLTSGEVIVLSTAYKIAKRGYQEFTGASEWLKMIAEDSGLVHRELVEVHEDSLLEKRLLTPRRLGDRSGVTVNPHFRLTQLAFAICQYVDKYEEIRH
jgi:hypothetical protein